MKQSILSAARLVIPIVALAAVAVLAACGERGTSASEAGVKQTKFPGSVSAGGGTSGEVIARAGTAKEGQYMRGTPGIPMGAGGNTGGAATGGTVQQPSASPSGSIPPPGEPAKSGK